MSFKTNIQEFINPSGQTFVPKGMNWSEPWLINSEDARQNVVLGANTVRVWCKQSQEFDVLGLVRQAGEAGLAIILVLGEMDKGPTNTLQPWRNTFLEIDVASFWKRMAKKMIAEPNILGFEILNEPSEVHDKARYGNFCRRITKEIHHVDPDRLVGIPALDVGSPSGLVDELVVNDPRVFYTFNFYDPYQVTHTRPPTPWPHAKFDLERMERQVGYAVAFRERNQVPILCGELGCLWHAPEDSELHWLSSLIDILDKAGVGWLFWGWKSCRGISFHINYNEQDKAIPPRMMVWEEARSLVEAKLKRR